MLLATLVLLLLTVIWGVTFPLVQGALNYASPLIFLAIRFLLAAAIFPLFVWPQAFRLTREVVWKGGALGVMLWGGYAFQTFGLQYTTAARSGFLTGILVPLTPLFAWLLFRDKISLRAMIAVALALVGITFMSNPGEGGLNRGDLLTLLCAMCFALQIVLVGRWAKREHEMQLTWLEILIAGLLSAIFAPFSTPHYAFSSTLLWAVLVCAVFATAFALWGQLRFQPRVSATAAAIIYACEPIFAGLAAWLMLYSVPSRATLIGALFIVAGMILSSTTKPATLPD